MSIKKLLCGASAVSLMAAGQAFALDLTAAPTVTIPLAEEVDFANETVAGNLPTVTISTNNDLPVSNGYKLTITLTGDAGFDGFNPVADVVSPGNISGQIVSTGGADGSKVVTVLFDVDTTGVTTVDLILPVEINSCASDVSVSILLTDPNDNPIEGGNASLVDTIDADPLNLLECVNAFQVAIFADDTSSPIGAVPTAAQGSQTLLELDSNFEQFVTSPDDSTSSALLGTIEVIVNTAAVGADLVTNAAATNLDDLEFDAAFTDETGFTALSVGAGVFAAPVVADDTAAPVYSVAGVITSAGLSPIELAITGADAITPQSGVIQNATVTFDVGSGFAGESVVVKANGLDNIALEGQSFGPYDWVGDASKPTGNVFRVTGLTATPQAAITISNASGGSQFDGTYVLDLAPLATGDGSSEYTIFPANIQAIVGAFGRADVTLTFFSSDVGVDVDRLMSAGGVISAFGNDANGDD